jgi:hypothetical protein
VLANHIPAGHACSSVQYLSFVIDTTKVNYRITAKGIAAKPILGKTNFTASASTGEQNFLPELPCEGKRPFLQ